jgi:archaellum biogenesis protein FlaJ (TadC family)
MTSFGLPIWARQRLWALLGGVGMMVGLLALLYVQPLTFAYAVPFHWLVMVVVMVLSVGLWRRLAERMIAEADRPSLIAISRLRPTNEAA